MAVMMHVAYHGGRLVTYTIVGAAAGSLGALLNLASTLAGLQPIALALAGGAMVGFGLAEIARLRGWSFGPKGHRHVPEAWTQLIRRGQRFAARRGAVPRALLIGMLTTLLPCGWLYAFVVTAAGSGDALGGAAVMAVFWVGTLPVMLSLGVGIRSMSGALGQRLPLATAVALIVVGVTTLSGRVSLTPEALAATVSAEAQVAPNSVPDPDSLPPCCRTQEASL